jgi:hypothetical protein
LTLGHSVVYFRQQRENNMELYAWLDRFDCDMVQLGTKKPKGGFMCWGQMHVDGIGETFGEEVKENILGSNGVAVCISSDRLSVDGNPLWDQKLEDFC